MASETQFRKFVPSPEETVYVELLRVADLLSRAPAQLLRQHNLSINQYNILRILRGAPDGLLCGEIGQRMISRDPDITRLLDRLEKRRLISRCREDEDRRKVQARITSDGLALLALLDPLVTEIHRRQLGHLGHKRIRELEALLDTCRPTAD